VSEIPGWSARDTNSDPSFGYWEAAVSVERLQGDTHEIYL
jgi:hypothetical protein